MQTNVTRLLKNLGIHLCPSLLHPHFGVVLCLELQHMSLVDAQLQVVALLGALRPAFATILASLASSVSSRMLRWLDQSCSLCSVRAVRGAPEQREGRTVLRRSDAAACRYRGEGMTTSTVACSADHLAALTVTLDVQLGVQQGRAASEGMTSQPDGVVDPLRQAPGPRAGRRLHSGHEEGPGR